MYTYNNTCYLLYILKLNFRMQQLQTKYLRRRRCAWKPFLVPSQWQCDSSDTQAPIVHQPMLKVSVVLYLVGVASSLYCENCRGVVTPFCGLSCTCSICTKGDGPEDFKSSDYGNYKCNKCWGKMTPWCGRWCWCSECVSVGLDSVDLFASPDAQTWIYALTVAICISFAALLALFRKVYWDHHGNTLESPLLHLTQEGQ